MPIYEYQCNSCDHVFEEWQKINDPPVKKCPSCNKRKVERLVSATSFQLKGDGWYVTDYGGKKPDSSGSGSSDKSKSSASDKPSKSKSTGTSD